VSVIVTRSKSGAQPLVLENLIVLLLPAFRLMVVCSEPSVVQLPVTGKLMLLPAPPLTLIVALRAAVSPLM